jgi:predicted metal-dependent hydrolase
MSGRILHPALPAPVIVKRSKLARRMTLRVDATLRAATLLLPQRASHSTAMGFLNDHLEWLRERLDALPPALPFLPGASVQFLGRPHLLRAAPAARRGVWVEGGAIHVSGPAEFLPRRVADFLKKEAKDRIWKLALPMAERIGREVSGVRIGDPKSRWGSCNAKGRLAFSWRLVLAPEEVLAYVVAHEVAHLREMNHSAKFWEWVRLLDPDPDTPRRWLKANGAGLYRYG